MRRTAMMGLLLGAAMLVVLGGARATPAPEGDGAPAAAVGAQYDAWSGTLGLLTLEGPAGAPFDVFDAVGRHAGHGSLEGSFAQVLAPNAGPGVDGVLLWVVVDGEIVAVADPEWDWN